jgi:GNAT superfamily N-acetyltransferase
MPVVDVTVYYLEMRSLPHRRFASSRDGLTVLHAQRPSVAYYRFLYNTVGRDYHWYSRGRRSDSELAAIIQHPLNEVHVLHVAGNPAGFAELDRRVSDEIELVQFGLMPEFIGQGLGRAFLQWTVELAWSYQPRRFWLHTCTLDHPAAIPNYVRAGFSIYREELIQREIPVTAEH